MAEPVKDAAHIALPAGFEFGPVDPPLRPARSGRPLSDLGPLAAFVGNFAGTGFNTIFRPDNPVTRTPLPNPVVPPTQPRDNVLELNLTTESLSFSPSLGSVPNRGSDPQGDVFLDGVPYLQAINDVTTPGRSVGIHVEPGLWMAVPPTADPALGPTLVRMGSIPHGTTIQAQGTATTTPGPPAIPPVDITPFPIGNPAGRIRFLSQTAANANTPRIPQDLAVFILAGTITQALLDDPNTLLRQHLLHQNVIATTRIDIATRPPPPLFGGGADNIAFLLGDNGAPLPTRPNAQAIQMAATFWIETVELIVTVPVYRMGDPPLTIRGEQRVPGHPAPVFSVTPPAAVTAPRPLTVRHTQIQYSQLVFLNFATLTWPHVSVATLVPSHPVVVPHSAWD